MNYTENYHLPQWVETDRVQMEDFNEAMANIEEGLADAYRPSNKPYTVGSYVGDGNETQTITLGFKPSFLIISRPYSSTSENANNWLGNSILTDGSMLSDRVKFTNDGFTVKVTNISDSTPYPNLNKKYSGYSYIAFR